MCATTELLKKETPEFISS